MVNLFAGISVVPISIASNVAEGLLIKPSEILQRLETLRAPVCYVLIIARGQDDRRIDSVLVNLAASVEQLLDNSLWRYGVILVFNRNVPIPLSVAHS